MTARRFPIATLLLLTARVAAAEATPLGTPEGGTVRDVLVTPDGTLVATTARHVSWIDGRTGAVRHVETGARALPTIARTPAGPRVVLVTGDGLRFFDLAGHATGTVSRPPSTWTAAAIDPNGDGFDVVVLRDDSGGVHVVEPVASEVLGTLVVDVRIAGNERPEQTSAVRFGDRIAVVSSTGRVFAFDVTGAISKGFPLFCDAVPAGGIAGGTRLGFGDTRGRWITVDTDGHCTARSLGTRPLTLGPISDGTHTWVSDGAAVFEVTTGTVVVAGTLDTPIATLRLIDLDGAVTPRLVLVGAEGGLTAIAEDGALERLVLPEPGMRLVGAGPAHDEYATDLVFSTPGGLVLETHAPAAAMPETRAGGLFALGGSARSTTWATPIPDENVVTPDEPAIPRPRLGGSACASAGEDPLALVALFAAFRRRRR